MRPLLISHLPNMAAITNIARRSYCPKVPQIAFSFNFTHLPDGLRRMGYAKALQGIDEFVVFSKYEKDLYADYFNIPFQKIHFMHWAMETPVVADLPLTPNPQPPYICAIGGEARDYALFADAMRNLPHRHAKLVARPYSIAGIDFPPNVEVHINLPSEVTWRLAVDSVGMALPLLSEKTTCGHITFVVAQLLGIPIVATKSIGLAEYLEPSSIFGLVNAGDVATFTQKIETLFTKPDDAKKIASVGQKIAKDKHTLTIWTKYLNSALERL